MHNMQPVDNNNDTPTGFWSRPVEVIGTNIEVHGVPVGQWPTRLSSLNPPLVMQTEGTYDLIVEDEEQ